MRQDLWIMWSVVIELNKSNHDSPVFQYQNPYVGETLCRESQWDVNGSLGKSPGAFREGWLSWETFPCPCLMSFPTSWNMNAMPGAAAIILQLWSKLENGNDVLRMMEQIKSRNLNSWWCCGASYHELPISDFFHIRKIIWALIWRLSVICSWTKSSLK